jgi:nucleotide-binding universal stress UspA family protein
MKNFEKVMIGLDLTAMDEILIQKVRTLISILGFEKLYLIHVAKNLVLPDDINTTHPNLLAPIDESIEAEIMAKLAKQGFPKDLEIEVEVKEGNPAESILRWAKIKNVDLIVMGRKSTLKGKGTLAKLMAKKSPCSVLFLNEAESNTVPRKILVPIDFSEHSKMTYSFAEKLTEEFGIDVIGLHLFEVPTGYYKTGKSYEEIAKIMEDHALKDYEKFLNKNKLKEFECFFVLVDDENESEIVLNIANKQNVEMILMGSRGRTASAALLLGSFAEKMVEINNQIPMLVFKNKNENMSLLDALKKV